jgi:hypothetical protein
MFINYFTRVYLGMYDFCEREDENTHLRPEDGSSNWAWGQKHEHPWNTHSEGVYLNEGEVDKMDADESLI